MPLRLFVLLLAVLCAGLVRAENDPLAAAKKMFDAKEYDAARLLLEVHLEAEPQAATAAEARFYLAESFMALGKYAEAEKIFDLLVKTAQKSAFAVPSEFRLAEMPYLQEKFAVAKPRLELFVERHPQDGNLQFVLYYLGEISLRAESYAEAQHYFGLSVRMFPKGEKFLESQIGLALALGLGGKKAESLKLFQLLSEEKRFLEMLKEGTLPEMQTLLNLFPEQTTEKASEESTQTAEIKQESEPKPKKVLRVSTSYLPSDESIIEKLLERHPLPKDAGTVRMIKGISKDLIGFERLGDADRNVSRYFFKCKVRYLDVEETPESLIDTEKDHTAELTVIVTAGNQKTQEPEVEP